MSTPTEMYDEGAPTAETKNIPVLPAVVLTLFFAGIALVLVGLYTFGWMKTWTFLKVPALYPPFADLRSVQGALRSIAKGFDPRVINPGDPWSRPMNYPIVWVKIARVFGLVSETRYLLFVTSYVIAYLACVCDLLRRVPSFWMLAAIFSGSSLLAMERGNNDLLIFVLLYLSSIVPALWISAAMIMLGAALKIYPIFAAASLSKNRRVFTGLLVSSILFFLFDFDDISKVRAATPISGTLSYGLPSIVAHFNSAMISVTTLLLGALLFMLIGAFLFSKVFMEVSVTDGAPEEVVRLFLLGSGVYLATFVLSSNWDYRLIFLVLCIPYLLHLRNKRLKNILLIQVLLASNLPILSRLLEARWGGMVNSLSKTAVFVIFSVFLIRELLGLSPNFGAVGGSCKPAVGLSRALSADASRQT